MDLNKLRLFTMMKDRMSWLTRRQEVVSLNIANADTPDYVPRDLKPQDFGVVLRRHEVERRGRGGITHPSVGSVEVRATRPGHLTGEEDSNGNIKAQKVKRPYETAPDGNSVVLEEQMMKISETAHNYEMTTSLYRKHLGMLKTAIGRGR